ncbi:ferredoxin--NADP reductase [Babesia ovis]|uniref:ferredoxin--NADP(+) reductase n=1 Tax=Babesia ovis TaxID=5869 RepID=A0A9W5TBF9_BABOV|nr:ferredoxin--NADP reductase [Babesia ovis]
MDPAWYWLWVCCFSAQFVKVLKGYIRNCENPIQTTGLFSLSESDGIRYTVRKPLDCEIKSVRKLGSNDVDRNFFHVVIDHHGQYQYMPGQYCGIIPPGISERTNRPFAPRSYSIAPVLDEDDVDPSRCFSLSVRAPIVTGANQEEYKNIYVCSQFLTNSTPGTQVRLTGPFGRFLLTPADLRGERNLILIATGTGIVPCMGFLRALSDTPMEYGKKLGRILLIFGIQSPLTYLYRENLELYESKFQGRLRVIPCYSRDGPEPERCYVQQMILRQQALLNEVCTFDGRDCGIYICGHRSMDNQVVKSLYEVFLSNPNRDQLLSQIKIEVYD